MDDEVWKRIPLDGADYEVSNMGQVRKRGANWTVRPRMHAVGYPTVRLVYYDEALKRKKETVRSLPKLVADAFLPPTKLPLQYFKDGNFFNCAASNIGFKDYPYKYGAKIMLSRKEKQMLEIQRLLRVEQASWDRLTYAQQQEDLKRSYRPMKGVYLKGPDEKRLPYYEGQGPATPSTTPQEIHNETTEETLTEDSSPAPRVQSSWLPGALAALDAEIDRELSNEGEEK